MTGTEDLLNTGPPSPVGANSRRRGPRIRACIGIAVIGTVLALLVLARGPLLFLARGGLHLPAPSGPHAVGRVTWHVVSPDRPEQFTEDPGRYAGNPRGCLLPRGGERRRARGQSYIEPSIAEGATGMPAFFTSAIRPNWRDGAKPAAGRPWPRAGVLAGRRWTAGVLHHAAGDRSRATAMWSWRCGTPTRPAAPSFPTGASSSQRLRAMAPCGTGDDAAREVPKQRVSEVWARDAVMALDEATRRNTKPMRCWAGALT
jgi:hypothetical protein